MIRGRLLMQDAEKMLEDPQLRREGKSKESRHQKIHRSDGSPATSPSQRGGGNEATRQAAYLLAVCLQKLENYKEAETQFARTHSEFTGTPESLAAGLGEAEMQLQLGKNEEALISYERVLSKAGSADDFHNPWVTLNDLRRRIEDAYVVFMAAQQYSLAIELTEEMAPIFPDSRCVQLRAEAQRGSADMVTRQADTQRHIEAKKSLADAQVQYRDAGKSFAKLAKLREATPDFNGDLWAAGECFLKGHDFDLAVKYIEKYLDQEPRKNGPGHWFRWAKRNSRAINCQPL